MWSDVLVIPSASQVVTTEFVKLHTRVYHTFEDALITSWISAGTEIAQQYQHRAYLTQTRRLILDRFPDGTEIRFPINPLLSVTSIKYYGTDDTEYTLAASSYYVDTLSEIGRISLNYATLWPTIVLRPINGVVIEYTCGRASADDVPDSVKVAVALYCAHMFENRDSESGTVPEQFFNLLRPDRLVVSTCYNE